MVFDAPLGPLNGKATKADLTFHIADGDVRWLVSIDFVVEGPGLGAMADGVNGVMEQAFGRYVHHLEYGETAEDLGFAARLSEAAIRLTALTTAAMRRAAWTWAAGTPCLRSSPSWASRHAPQPLMAETAVRPQLEVDLVDARIGQDVHPQPRRQGAVLLVLHQVQRRGSRCCSCP